MDDLHAYYIAPNVGKEAITINLQKTEGQTLLKQLIHELKVDIKRIGKNIEDNNNNNNENTSQLKLKHKRR